MQWRLSACLGALCSRLLGRKHLTHQTQRINPNPALHYLKMQVVAGAVACAAHIPNHLTSRHGFARRDGCCCYTGIVGFHESEDGYMVSFPDTENTQTLINDYKARLRDLENNIWQH